LADLKSHAEVIQSAEDTAWEATANAHRRQPIKYD
jgi:hypothetical protein